MLDALERDPGTTSVLDPPPGAHLDITPQPRRHRGPLLVPLVLLALAQAVVALDLDLPLLRPALALVTFVALPTLVLHRRGRSRALALPYAFGLSVLALVVGGLALDTVLPWVGVDRPLAPAPLAVAWLVADAALLAWRREVPLLTRRGVRRAGRRLLDARFELAPTLAVAALVLSVAGAIRLDNGASGAVAVTAVVVSGAALLALALGPARSTGRDAWVIGLVAAGLLLATSLRGWGITGHDVQAEYLAFQLTNHAQDWQMSALPSAYNACLSVTILPTVLSQTTGLSGLVVFKWLLQLLFATVPVLTYLFARRFVPRPLAIAAAVLTVAFPTFFTDMPYLVRQEVAFFFLALVLLAVTERAATGGLPARTARALVLTLSVGVVLSHYSTTYVLLMAMVAALAGSGVLALVRRRRGDGPGPDGAAHEPLVLLHPAVVAALVAATLAWAGPITHTGGHAREVLGDTVRAITGHGSDEPGSSDTSYFLFGDDTSPQERMDMFVQATLDYRDERIPPRLRVIPDPGPAELSPEVRTQPSTPVKVACAVLMEGFLLLGLLRLLRRRRLTDDSDPPPREVTLLVWGSMAALGLIVLVPNLSVDYGVLRAFQQTLLVVAPVMAAGMWMVVRRWVLAAVVPVALLVVLAGTQQRMALANAGSYYDRFYVTDSEGEGLGWLGAVDHADRTNERLIANRNLDVRMLALSDNRAPIADRLYPTLLSRDAYVFVDGQILDRGESTVFYTGDLLTYRYPLHRVDERLDLLYDAPQARVYR
ncbi:hypothetical protein [Nocardioides sp.]|uniref:hypothetical protein n=1 Tax=Nocardioides sp. TaxID=35761 RepID=UPI003784ECBC